MQPGRRIDSLGLGGPMEANKPSLREIDVEGAKDL